MTGKEKDKILDQVKAYLEKTKSRIIELEIGMKEIADKDLTKAQMKAIARYHVLKACGLIE